MVTKKPKIVIIGAGMAGLTAANRLYTCTNSDHLFELSVVEGGSRIGGRISSSELCGDRIEQGATWIHGIEGSPIYKIAQEINALHSNQPWECMDGIPHRSVTVAEGGHRLNPSTVEPISTLFKSLVDYAQGKGIISLEDHQIMKNSSVGSFLRRGLEAYMKGRKGAEGVGNWTGEALEERIFAMHESTQRTFTSAHDLGNLDYVAEKEYVMFPGEEITIARGYSTVIKHLASVLPPGTIQLGRKVEKIEWHANAGHNFLLGNGCDRPVKLHFGDGSTMTADHVIVTVSLGVLKQGTCLFDPPLPGIKIRAISRLGYGVVDKVFLRLTPSDKKFPFLQMVFHPQDSELSSPKIPPWIRKTSFLSPIYSNSRTLLSWFTGPEALELESLPEEDIISGFSATVTNLLASKPYNGRTNNEEIHELKFEKVLRTRWGTNPLFLGSYSFIAVGSSIQDMDTLSEPLPLDRTNVDDDSVLPPLQILFAGEATHSKHYSTTHGAYFSGLREANRLLKHYNHYTSDA